MNSLEARQGLKSQEIFFRELASELLPYLKRLQWQSDNQNRERALLRKNRQQILITQPGPLQGWEIIFGVEEAIRSEDEDKISDHELVRRPVRTLRQSKLSTAYIGLFIHFGVSRRKNRNKTEPSPRP